MKSEDDKPPLPAEIGEVIDGYRLDALLVQGGMATVYQATHQRIGRKVALKMLSTNLASEGEFISRFLHEARIVNDVRHPNIVDIYDFIELENPKRVAFVMELLIGGSLASSLKARALTPRQAINVALQIISALRAVHAIGVIHRDLKPDNLFIVAPLDTDLSFTPCVKILDFGIAKTSASANAAHKTGAGLMIGTPAYMAPEQIASEPVSPATDIYAIGEIFYEMISGARLFRGEALEVLKQKLRGERPQVEIQEGTPGLEAIADLVTSCIAHRPEDRPSLETVEKTLFALMELQPIHTVDLVPHPAVPAARRPSSAHTPLNLSTMPGLAPPARSRILPILGTATVLGAVAIAWTLAHRPSDIVSEQLPPEPAPQQQIAKIDPPPTPIVDRTVHLNSTPTGAEVIDDGGRVLGKTPLSLKLAADKPSLKVSFKLAGHRPLTIDVPADQASMTVALAPVSVESPSPMGKSISVEKPRESTAPLKKKLLKSW